jgi:hypothetical protein
MGLTELISEAVDDALDKEETRRSDHAILVEKQRRASLSPKKAQLQKSADEIQRKLNLWNDKAYSDGKGGVDHSTIWECIHGLEALHRNSSNTTDPSRWFASWVMNQLIAVINTREY